MYEGRAYGEMQSLLQRLQSEKPNDRSEADRHYAITITDCQRMIAFFKTYVVDREDGDGTDSKQQAASS